MATDYDAPRKRDDETESLEVLKETLPDKSNPAVDADETDNGEFTLGDGPDLSNVQLDVEIIPPQEDEFTCVECFLVKHRTQFDHNTVLGPVCKECAANS